MTFLFAENNPAGAKAFLAELGIIKNVHTGGFPIGSIKRGCSSKVKSLS